MKFLRSPLNRALLNKSIGEARLLLLGASLVMFGFCWVRVWIVSLLPMERFKTILEQFQEFERFLPVPFEQLITYVGRIALTYDELIVVMCVAVWAIARGSDCISGELGRGTMEMLLAQPVSRLKILVMHGVTTTVGTATLALASWVGIWVGIHTTHTKEPIELPVWRARTRADWIVFGLAHADGADGQPGRFHAVLAGRVSTCLLSASSWQGSARLCRHGIATAGERSGSLLVSTCCS